MENMSDIDRLITDWWLAILEWLRAELHKIRSEHGWENAPYRFSIRIKGGKNYVCVPIPKSIPTAEGSREYPIHTPQIEALLHVFDLPAFIYKRYLKPYVCTDDPERLYQALSSVIKGLLSQ
ncbi:hypothetical protein TTSV1_gp02 [Thermoproteus tenax spherical virus 1]|uniref:Uncharacterized protein n=1 Tax=Thermoproteus tenax spherical virus 1 TaxID=292639 RepID=Q647G0_9VIRU|nr:hypothetical protein TTSV1_gp02 [Thermoproteus tenax spherical virus 1]AAU25952.1 hypothetical protein [Thermoproteus tenax spherical virus 1]